MSTVNGTFNLTIGLLESLTGGAKSGGVVHSFDLASVVNTRIASGTAAGQMDKIFSEKATTIGTSSTVDRDFAGVLLNTSGAAETFVSLKLLCIYNSGTVPITVKGKVSNVLPFFSGSTDTITIKSGGILFYFDPVGIAVGAGATDQITLGNASGVTAAAFTLIAGGTSA